MSNSKMECPILIIYFLRADPRKPPPENHYQHSAVLGLYGDGQTVIDDGLSKRLTLKNGSNVVRFADINAGGATDFCARFLDADEKPVNRFTLSVGENKN